MWILLKISPGRYTLNCINIRTTYSDRGIPYRPRVSSVRLSILLGDIRPMTTIQHIRSFYWNLEPTLLRAVIERIQVMPYESVECNIPSLLTCISTRMPSCPGQFGCNCGAATHADFEHSKRTWRPCARRCTEKSWPRVRVSIRGEPWHRAPAVGRALAELPVFLVSRKAGARPRLRADNPNTAGEVDHDNSGESSVSAAAHHYFSYVCVGR